MSFAFCDVVQLRNPTVLRPKNVGDVARRAYFTTVSREGCKLAAVVTTRLDDEPLAHGTTAHVVGTAHNVLDTLFVDAESITLACDEDGQLGAAVPGIARLGRYRKTVNHEADKVADGSLPNQAIFPVVGGPWSMTRDEKEQAFKGGVNRLILVDITTSRGEGRAPVICVRTAIDATPATGVMMSASPRAPLAVYFLGTLAEVSQDCVVADLSEIRFVTRGCEFVVWDSRGRASVAQSGRDAFLAFLGRIFRRSSGRPAGTEGRMEIYSTGIFYSHKKRGTL